MTHYTQLTMQDRCHFTTLLDMNMPLSEIANRMGCHRSTLYRELQRNSVNGIYRPGDAHHKALLRKQRKCYIQRHPTLREYVVRHLKAGWSPEQIVGRLKRKKSQYVICHETIYRFIYKHGHYLHRYLPYKKPKRIKPCARKRQKCRYGEKRLITQRQNYIETRKSIGHWEGDLIEFKGNKTLSVTTLVERKTRLVFLIKNNSKESKNIMQKIAHKLSGFSQQICRSITFDQGNEFACFNLLEAAIHCKAFYCHTHSPWEKGSNENMNGRLRLRGLPKEADIAEINQERLDEIADQMNNTPRKCLDFRTPKELFLSCHANLCRTSL